MPNYALLISGGIDSRVLRHMYPDAYTVHYQFPIGDGIPPVPEGTDRVIDISSYEHKHEGMSANTLNLLADSDLALDNVIYGLNREYPELSDLGDAPVEGENDLIKPLENWYKHDIIRYASENNIDLSDTVSCLMRNDHQGCWPDDWGPLKPITEHACYQCQEIQMALDKLDSDGFDYTNVIRERG